jgi:hypothetical protein
MQLQIGTPSIVTNTCDNMNLQGRNIDTMKKIAEALIDVSKEVGLEVDAEKIKYMLLSPHQRTGQIYNTNSIQLFIIYLPSQ